MCGRVLYRSHIHNSAEHVLRKNRLKADAVVCRRRRGCVQGGCCTTATFTAAQSTFLGRTA